MSFILGIITLYCYFTNTPDSFIVWTGPSPPHKKVRVQPEAGDTIESLMQKIRDCVKDKGGVWMKKWMPPKNPSELEKAFDEALEWNLALIKFEGARASMMKSTLRRKYGNENYYRLLVYMCQAIYGDATNESKPWFWVDDSVWQWRKNLAGMTREKAMQHVVEEVDRQRKMFSNETV